ncbi:MAG: hypothetical protein JO309_06880 [Pseudonocardiales bacterium]|nr:hypothetical protein [Pseudonocardiales bacterium]MBV9729119.1 hypothetical protein [Pseudonocardiales bacterium]
MDWIVIGAGLLAYISSFLPWYTAHVSVLSITRSASVDAWHAGFSAWCSVLLLVVAGVLVLVSTLGGLGLTASRSLITLVVSVLAFVTLVLRWVTFPDAGGGLDRFGERGDVDLGGAFTVSSGAGAGLYLGLIAAIAAVVASLLTFRAAGRNVAS